MEEQAKAAQGTYLHCDAVRQFFEHVAAAVRSEIEKLPTLMAPDMPPDWRDALVTELRNHVRQILRRLAARGRHLADDDLR